MRIDAHQHFWQYNPKRDTWIDETMQVIRRDFLPEDLKPVLNQNNIDACIAVQADQSEEESDFLLDLANKNDFIKGVVGWIDLCAENVEDRLAYFAENQKFKGVRHIVQAEPDDFLLRKDFHNGISKLNQFNLTYDILIHKGQLENSLKLVAKFPNQLFVLDHLGKPNIKDSEIEPWKTDIQNLAKHDNVFCKISGMITEADWKNWQYEDLLPYLDVVLEAFGTDRLMFGSDWPVCLIAGSYSQVLEIVTTYIKQLSKEEQKAIMGENALKFYKIN